MRINEERKTLLVENPLTGNNSFAKGLKMDSVIEVDKWATPDQCRAETPDWKDYEKYILVRDIQARFESGATLVFSNPDEFAGPMQELVDSVPVDASPTQRGKAVLDYMKAGGEVPVFMQGQHNWLSAHFNMVLATYSIAEFANERGIYIARDNRIVRTVDSVDVLVPSDGRKTLNEIYAKDLEIFERLLVWSPDPEKIRLVTGYCASCQKKKEEGWKPLDLTETEEAVTVPVEGKEEGATDIPVAKAKKTRRRRKSELDNEVEGE